MLIADLHIHSRFSRATSRECDAPHLDLWARRKGVDLLGTGDFTHPAWRKELLEALEPAGEGVFALKKALRLPCEVEGEARFVLSAEISSIYKKDGRTRKVHNVILMPSFEAAERLSARLERVGNLHSDGRPILGLDCRDLLEMTLEACPEAVFIPAHIWTPHFSLLGAFSGFDSIEECFGDLSCHIRALETGLSSDPPMNWRVSALDGRTLVSNSDAHSPAKLAREANLLSCETSYPALRRAIETGEGFEGTIEFFPEEGKYHLDGHRACDVCLEPSETMRMEGRCPACGRKLTIGVKHRAEDLADRPEGCPPPASGRPFESLMPLPEVLSSCMGVSSTAKKVMERYFALLSALGNELYILRECPLGDIRAAGGWALEEGVRRLRAGRVLRKSGYDGEYGVISIFAPGELEVLGGQMAMFDMAVAPQKAKAVPVGARKRKPKAPAGETPSRQDRGLNEEQRRAVESEAPALAVVAGPGTGKTFTLVERVVHLLANGAKPSHITAVTFTDQAARELRERLAQRLGARRAKPLHIGTFHALCLQMLDARPLLGEDGALEVLRGLPELGKRPPRAALRAISTVKNGAPCAEAGIEQALVDAYQMALRKLGARDLDDLLLDALRADVPADGRFDHLLVDEFQDINAVQRALVRHWSAAGESLFVIGDPDQSIYGFRGADAACFERLRADMPSLETVRLTLNYRCAPDILRRSQMCICHNPGPARVLRPAARAGAPVRLVRADTAFSEAVWIAKEVARLAGGVDMLAANATEGEMRAFSEMAVLARTHRQLDLIEECLAHDGIPCVVAGREDYLESDDARGALAFFRSLAAPGDLNSLRAALRLNWGLDEDAFRRAAPCAEPLARAEALRDAAGAGEYVRAVTLLAPKVDREAPERLLRRWIAMRGASEALERLASAASFHETLAGFLAALDIGEEADVRRRNGKARAAGAVTLMTLHGAKGLEFPVVFLAGVAEGVLPLSRPGAEADVEEERRLFFVGMTRAKEELILTCPGAPSCFIGELGEGLAPETARSRVRPPKVEQLTLF
ncbi:MAG TPA: UvrD-helicase domain-containing protein [Candidatus Pullichristensenella stercoripullorum]|nr:UvrD-helicase domain-containing protein [Candidatus Pullichristensenella stercoripullorum]